MIGTSRSVWGFDPRSVPGCQLWLDGADATTVTLSGSSVTQWRDKSGNGNNATPYSGTVTYSSVSNAVSFSEAGLQTPIVTPTNRVGSGFFVVKVTSSPSVSVFQGSSGSPGGRQFRNDNGTTLRTVKENVADMFFSGSTVINTLMIAGYIDDGTNLTHSVNGTLYSTTTAITFASGTTVLIGFSQTAEYLVGNIHEVVLFNTALTTTQRQQIEGYLAHKWGLTGYYDSSIPLSIPGCQLWLDAADSSTITLSTTKVTQWNDKSGNGYNFTQSTSGNQPTYSTSSLNGLNTITFTSASSNYLLGTASTNFIGTNSLSVYGVFKTNNNTSSSAVFSKSLYGSAEGRILYGFRESGTPGTIIGGIGGQSSNAYTAISDTYTGGSWRVFGFVSDRSGWTNTTYQNGTSIGTATISSNTTTNLTNAFPMLVGAYNNGSGGANPPQPGYYLDGGVGELLVFSTALTTTQRQTIEGYLSKKWGIGSSPMIPSTHPFSSIRPHLRTFQPIDVPGCALWLDAADSSTITLSSGSNVSSWRDKTGNGNNGTAVNTPTYSSTLNAIACSSGACFSLPNGAFPFSNTSYTYFHVFTPTSGGTYNNLFGGGVAGSTRSTTAVRLGASNVVQTYWWSNGISDLATSNTYTVNAINIVETWYTSGGTRTITLNFAGSNSDSPAGPGSRLQSNTSNFLGNASDNSFGGSLNGNHYEFLVYDTALTTSQRQQVEGYLAHKWGLSLSLPVISPLSIPGCQLWLDAADSSTVAFSSGSNVSSWTNKGIVSTTATPTRGPSANQITYTTIGGYPGVYINNNGSVGYNASTYSQLNIQSNFQNTADYSVFAVVNLSNVPAGELQTIYGNARGTSGETRTPNFGAGASLEFNGDGANRMINGAFIGTGRLQTALISSSSALTAYTNATAYGSNTNGFTRVSTDAGPLPMIGGAFGSINDARFATGYFHEILFYNSVLTTSQRQQIEGYLARKWGISISATLPSPHPFKSFPPASLPFSPRNISGLALWLDAADQSSMTLSGSNVTQIRDKSSNAYTFTGSAGTYPTRTATLNGLPVISSATGQYLQTTSFNQNFLTATSFIVIRPTQTVT